MENLLTLDDFFSTKDAHEHEDDDLSQAERQEMSAEFGTLSCAAVTGIAVWDLCTIHCRRAR